MTAISIDGGGPIWVELDISNEQHSGRVWVTSDALRMDGVRFMVSAQEQQKFADENEASLLTPKLADLIYEQAETRVEPSIRPAHLLASMATPEAAERHSRECDEKLAAAGAEALALVDGVGKHWVLTNRLGTKSRAAANYGWHTSNGGYALAPSKHRGWQPLGTAHDHTHADYSQTCRLVLLECEVNGQTMSLHELLRSQELSPMVSYEWPNRYLRQPLWALSSRRERRRRPLKRCSLRSPSRGMSASASTPRGKPSLC